MARTVPSLLFGPALIGWITDAVGMVTTFIGLLLLLTVVIFNAGGSGPGRLERRLTKQ